MKVIQHLWFERDMEAALRFYCALIPGSSLDWLSTVPGDTPSGPEGSVGLAGFTLGDQRSMAIEAGPLDPFNHSFSIMVECDDQAGIDRLWDALPEGGWEVCFTPGGDCAGLIVAALGQARQRVLVQAYAFTSAPIARALVEAHRRGVEVRVILDRSQLGERYGSGTFLSHAGIPVLVDDPPGIAHSKVMVIDGEAVITGSFNFTRAAQERNAENLLLLRDPRLAAAYAANWWRRRAVSVPYDEASVPSAAADGGAPDSGKHARHNLF